MRILSIDVGMRHLAYCILNADKDAFQPDQNLFKFEGVVEQWDIVNLCDDDKSPCQGTLKNGKPCSKLSTYYKNDESYCKTHAKKAEWKISTLPINKLTVKALNKLTVAKLKKAATDHQITLPKKILKVNIIALLHEKIKKEYFEGHESVNSNTLDNLTLAKTIIEKLPELFDPNSIELVVIENQMGKQAVRMSVLQGMLVQHFAERGFAAVQIVSPRRKLKRWVSVAATELGEGATAATYAGRKKMGIAITQRILEESETVRGWLTQYQKHGKKDDMADSFLQILGVWEGLFREE